jgi:hypothetical protein
MSIDTFKKSPLIFYKDLQNCCYEHQVEISPLFNVLKLRSIELGSMELRDRFYLRITVLSDQTEKRWRYQFSDLFHRSRSSASLFFLRSGNETLNIDLPRNSKLIFTLGMHSEVKEPFEIKLDCQFHIKLTSPKPQIVFGTNAPAADANAIMTPVLIDRLNSVLRNN